MEGKDAKCTIKRHKVDKHNRHDKQRNKDASKQKVVSTRDKCRFGSDVHNFIVLNHGRHISKQLMHGHVSKHVKMHRNRV